MGLLKIIKRSNPHTVRHWERDNIDKRERPTYFTVEICRAHLIKYALALQSGLKKALLDSNLECVQPQGPNRLRFYPCNVLEEGKLEKRPTMATRFIAFIKSVCLSGILNSGELK